MSFEEAEEETSGLVTGSDDIFPVDEREEEESNMTGVKGRLSDKIKKSMKKKMRGKVAQLDESARLLEEL